MTHVHPTPRRILYPLHTHRALLDSKVLFIEYHQQAKHFGFYIHLGQVTITPVHLKSAKLEVMSMLCLRSRASLCYCVIAVCGLLVVVGVS